MVEPLGLVTRSMDLEWLMSDRGRREGGSAWLDSVLYDPSASKADRLIDRHSRNDDTDENNDRSLVSHEANGKSDE